MPIIGIRRLAPVFLTIALLQGRCIAAEPATRPSAEQRMADLVEQLGDADPAIRSRAQGALVRMGKIAAPALQEAAKSANPEVEMGATSVLAWIADPLTPTYVTVDVDSAPLEQVLALLAAQTGLPVSLAPQSAKLGGMKITLHATEEPLLNVWVRICEQVNLLPSFQNGGWVLGKGLGAWSGDRTTVQGTLAVNVAEAQRQTMIEYSSPPEHRSSLQIAAYCSSEGKISVIGLEDAQIKKCQDATGRPVDLDIAPMPPRSLLLTVHGNPTAPLSIEGNVNFVVGARQDHIEVADLATAKETKKVAGILRLTFEHCRGTIQREWAVRFIIYRDRRDDATWAQLMDGLRTHAPILLDAKARPLENHNSEIITTDAEKFEIDYKYGNSKDAGRGVPDRPVKLTWEVPTRPATVNVPFRFKRVPLP